MKVRALYDIFEDENEGKIVLPNFQREFVWEEKQQKELLATFLVELPISSILLLKGSPDDFNYRKLCFKEEVEGAREECYYLLDGQQRMSTLKSIFYNFFDKNWEDNWTRLYGKLRNVWFLRMKNLDEDSFDIFGYEDLNFANENLRKFTPQEVVDNIEVFRILKTKKDCWYHPEYKFLNSSGEIILNDIERKNEYIKKCAREYLIPLNGLVIDKNIQQYILSRIADNRINEIFLEIEEEEDEVKKLQKIQRYFSRPELTCSLSTLVDYENLKEKLKYEICANWRVKVGNFLDKLLRQEISLIEIEKNEISRGIAIFETINKGGTPLDNFDLIVAKSAKDSNEKALTQRVREYLEKDIIIPESVIGVEKEWNARGLKLMTLNDEISKKIKNQYLNTLSIFFHIDTDYESLKVDHIKRDKIFEMTPEGINSLTEKTIDSILRTLAFCNLRLGIIELGDISFELTLIPLAYLLSRDEIWTSKKALDKLEYWYWVSVFTGRYREKQNIRAIDDLKTLCHWIIEENYRDKKVIDLLENKINKVLTVDEYSDLKTLKDGSLTPTPVVKGILSYVLSRNPFDLLIGEEERIYSKILSDPEYKLEEHHLVPLGGDKKLGELSSKVRNDKSHILNSVLNKTKISKKANRDISNLKISEYISQVKEICRISHCIPINLERGENESLNKYFDRLVGERYIKIRETILDELHNLKM